MYDKVLNAFFNQRYQICLNLCEQALNKDEIDKEFLTEFAALSCIKLEYWEKALEYSKSIFECRKTNFWALNLAKTYGILGNFKESFKLFDELLKNEEFWDDAASEYVRFLAHAQDIFKAQTLYEKLVKKDPFNIDLWENYATLFFNPNPKKSLALHEKICELVKEKIKDLNENKEKYKDNSLNLESRIARKEDELPQVSQMKNYLNTKIYPQMAFLYFKLLQIEDSLKLFGSLEEYNQNNASFWQNYAKVLEFSSNYEGALEAYKKSISLHNHATYFFDLAYLLMRVGNFDEGVKHYEARLFYANHQSFSQRHYTLSLEAFNKQGMDAFKDKVVMIFCEQGFGDTFMFSRGLEKLCKIAKKVLFAPQDQLYELFKQSIEKINKEQNKFPNLEPINYIPKDFDYAFPISSLLAFCKMSKDDILTLTTPIYVPNSKKQNKIKKIGIFWNTPMGDSPMNPRNFELGFFIKALKDLPYELISFQKEGNWDLPQNIRDESKNCKNWLDTYEFLEELDLLVAIDTAITHLGLAMQVPTIVLLHPRFDWRWGRFEKPGSYFWPKANILVVREYNDGVRELRARINELLS